jgi:phosphohistidine phosphatase
MKTLLILRHAKSSWADNRLGDHDRPLDNRGKVDAPKMGKLLERLDLVPDLIVSSSAKRAKTTAELAASSAGYDKQIKITRQLYHAGPEEYFQALQSVEDKFERVMVVGHNPGMEELIEVLSGVYEGMPTAALARIELKIESWKEIGEETKGRLVNLWRPKEL